MTSKKHKYMVKFLTRTGDVHIISPLMTMKEAQKISRDLQLTDLTAWVTDRRGEKLTSMNEKMIIYVDIDETICITPEDRDYSKASPIQKHINKINELYDNGNTIIYWTARGTGSGIDWREVTERQFKKWGVKYHKLNFGKPIYDIFIDDKNINTENFFS